MNYEAENEPVSNKVNITNAANTNYISPDQLESIKEFKKMYNDGEDTHVRMKENLNPFDVQVDKGVTSEFYKSSSGI